MSRVDYRRRARVVPDAYCPRCLTRTERAASPVALRWARRLLRLALTPRLCGWCGWSGLQVARR